MMSSGKTILFSIFYVVTNILISCTLLTGAEHTCEISLNQSTGLIDVTQADYKNLYCDWKIGNFGITDAVALFLFDQTAIVSCSEYVKIFSGDGTLVYHKEGCCPNDPGSFIEIPFMQSVNIKVNILLTELQSRITSHFVILKHGLHSATYTPGWLASVDNITSSSILIQWNNLTSFINRELLHYIVLLSSSDGSPPYHANVDGSRLYIEIYGLDHSQRYHMEVFGVDALGYCYKTLEVNATTKKVSCGYRPSDMRIVGGSVAPINSWPWQAMLRNSYGWQFCGGSLIHPFWVVTAAHCVHGKSASSVKVLLGAHYKSYGNVSTEQNFDVIKIIEHESYNSPYRWSNDIALLRLSKPAKLGKGVGLVCPPDTSFKLPFDSPNKKCWITGWGRLSYNGTYPNELMQVDLPLVSKKRCITSYPDKIDDSMICVGQDEGGIGGCSGDSGGPLVCEFSGKWYLEGATSWGSKRCADPLKYTVYANIRHLKSWITSKMSSFPVTAFYLSCNFDKSLCSGWEQSYSDAFDWTRHRGSTPSLSTGPSYDHTSGSGYYMYIEASSPRVMGDKAKLELSLCGNGDEACLTFYYHMYGNTTGTLNVFSGSKVVFSASGNKGNYWQKAERTIYLDKVVTFEGIVGSSFKGDIAIDDVSIKSGRCLTSPATTTCNFDSRLCSGWLQSYSDVFDWTRNRGATTSSNTGPDYDHTTGFGYYMYIEATKKNAGDNAKLKLYLNGNGEVSCLRFYYHMYGDTIGALNVYSENHLIFNSIGNHGNLWIKAERTFHSDTTLTFEGIVGYSFTGDIAIDDVTVSSGSCSGQTPPPTWHSALTTIEPSLKPNSSNNVTTQKPSMPVNSPTTKGNFTSTHVLTYNPTTIPRTPSAKEIQEAVMLKMTNFDMKKWKEMEADFKREVASAANEYCADGGASCQTSLRRRRSSDSMKNLIGNPQFSDDMVQIVSGYPRLSPDDPSITLLAFYLQLPGGVGDNLVSEDVLKNIVKSDIKSIEGSMGVSITTVQSMPSTKNEVDQEDETDDKGSISTSVIVGVTLGSLSLLGILIAVNLFIKSNRFGPKRRALSTDKVNQGIELDQEAVNKNADKHGVTSSKPSGTTIAGVSVEETSLDEEYHEEKLPRPGEEIPPNENVNC